MTVSGRSVSEHMKAAREAGELNLDAIAKETCVSITYLRAIESGDFDALPAEPFAAGFVKSYARALGLDPKEMLALYKAETCPEVSGEESSPEIGSSIDIPVAHIVSTKSDRKLGWKMPTLAIASLAGSWLMLGANLSGPAIVADASDPLEQTKFADANTTAAREASVQDFARDAESLEVQNQPLEISLSDNTVSEGEEGGAIYALDQIIADTADLDTSEIKRPLFDNAAYADPVIESGGYTNVRVDAVEDSWVRFSHADGSEIWAGILTAGESFGPQIDGNVRFSTSNAGGVRIFIDNAEIRSLGDRGALVRSVELASLSVSANN